MKVARYVFASGSQMDEDLVDVPEDATDPEILKGIARAITRRDGSLEPVVVARDRDRGGRWSLVFTARLQRVELVDLKE